jgi:hypothetical protein
MKNLWWTQGRTNSRFFPQKIQGFLLVQLKDTQTQGFLPRWTQGNTIVTTRGRPKSEVPSENMFQNTYKTQQKKEIVKLSTKCDGFDQRQMNECKIVQNQDPPNMCM